MISKQDFDLILSDTYQKLINEHLLVESSTLAFKLKDSKLATSIILDQISSKRKASKKNIVWYNTSKIVYPPPLSLEQSSSDITATFKSTLVTGDTLVDLTGGMGVDSLAFSKTFKKVIYVEQDEMLCKIAKHNFIQLNAHNIEVVHKTAEDFLSILDHKVDCIYIDPARRDVNKNKVFMLKDCTPNIVNLMPILKTHARKILVKSSPLLDITQSINELKYVSRIEIVADKNECKELLFLIEDQLNNQVEIRCTNLGTEQEDFITYHQVESAFEIDYEFPKRYLYEPNAAILKSGAFKHIAHKYLLSKLHTNTQLYTSDVLLNKFPGRGFSIIAVCKYNRQEIIKFVDSNKANITVRNFPESVDQIRKKLKIKDGGDWYIFATTIKDDKLKLLLCKKIKSD